MTEGKFLNGTSDLISEVYADDNCFTIWATVNSGQQSLLSTIYHAPCEKTISLLMLISFSVILVLA